MILWFVLGLVALVVGAELLVRGASLLAKAAGLSPLVIGLTIVAFGTSAPELAVSVYSTLHSPTGGEIALGNIVGSNIFNVLFILGLAAVIAPLTVSHQLIKADVPIMIGASILAMLMALDGNYGRLDGAILFIGIVAFTVFAIYQNRHESIKEAEENQPQKGSRGRAIITNFAIIIVGLILLILGSQWLIETAVILAQWLGVSQLIIGLTIVAVGTSLPEAATSIVASIRGERDIAVGNIVGSNIFNLFSVLGVSALVAPHGIPVGNAMFYFNLPVMLLVAIACLPIFWTGYRISRWEGLVFFGCYILLTIYYVYTATAL